MANINALVISVLATYNNHSVVELTACGPSTDKFVVNLAGYDLDHTTRDYFENVLSNPIAVTNGERFYIFDDDLGNFNAFFGFLPGRYSADREHLTGTYNFVSSYTPSNTAYDVYGTVGTSLAGGPADFSLGWAGRKKNRLPKTTFDINDWNVYKGATDNNPVVNSASKIPIRFGEYTCHVDTMAPSLTPPVPTSSPTPPVPTPLPTSPKPTPSPIPPEPTPFPSLVPTLKPTNPHRLKVTPAPVAEEQLAPPPVAPTTPKPNNPPRAPAVRNNRRPRGPV